MFFCRAMFIVKGTHWLTFKIWLDTFMELNMENPNTACLTTEVWRHQIAMWKLPNEVERDGVICFVGVTHRRSAVTLPLYFSMAVPKTSTVGLRPDAYIDHNSTTAGAKLKIVSSGVVVPLLPLGENIPRRDDVPPAMSDDALKEVGIDADMVVDIEADMEEPSDVTASVMLSIVGMLYSL